MKLYKAVSAQDELPEDGIYHVISKPGRDGSRYYESNLFENGKWDLIGFEIEYWLKHTTLSEIIKERITEEEIKELIMLSSKASIVEAHGKKYTGITTDINKAAKAIMDKLTNE
ncbi:MAG TPA: hypothetical protein ENO18_06905 [Caldithrix sp.]|nr:hypothetical protein [Caldithrix sp.]